MFHSRCVANLISAGALVVAAGPAAAGGLSAAVTFETVPLNTQFGGSFGQSPGDTIFTENGIAVGVEEFTPDFGGPLFGSAQIGGFSDINFPTTPLTVSNILLDFDFSGVGFGVKQASFEFADFGGVENLGVNGTVIVVDFSEGNVPALPATIAGVTIERTLNPATTEAGVITLTGDLQSIQIGGQELGIDNVIATDVPEPATLSVLALAGACLARRRRA
ncbi:MAG: PEP-CTERM sorting domain-containing protein [Planctomycetota bacterium]